MERNKKIISATDGQASVCPQCGHSNISKSNQTQSFTYGRGSEAVQLVVEIPVRSCVDCGFEYLDPAAELIRHNAVCRHLGLMTPSEVSSIRKQYNLSRNNFSKLTRIGEASLARWEAASLIQNAAYDQFLYLLTFEDNLNRLLKRRPAENFGETQVETQAVRATTRREVHGFRMITTLSDDQIIGKECFQLHPKQMAA